MIFKKWRWGRDRFLKQFRRRKLRLSLIEQLERREMLAIDGWHNVLQPISVLGGESQQISPLDVLSIINEINAPVYSSLGNGRLPENPPPDTRPPFYDVDCDGYVGPLDALNVINVLNGQPLSPGWKFHGEGNIASGFVSASACSPKINEGTSYKTELVSEVTLPTAGSAIRVSFESPAFDTSTTKLETNSGWVRATLVVTISGQWYDWGKSKRLIEDILAGINSDLINQNAGQMVPSQRVA